jgi:Fur family ferric uptake transcriptional regulator
METGRSEIEVFEEFLQKKKLKFTKERQIILAEVFSRHDHFDAEQLISDLQAKKERVSRATIYRSLDLLLESQLIQSIDLGDRGRYFEHVFGHHHHDHMICIGCRKVIEFHNAEIENLQDLECEKYNFKLLSHRLELKGLCEDCQKKEV